MKKTTKLIFVVLIYYISTSITIVYAGPGCCSHHNGVDKTKCTTDGRQVCKDYDSNGNEVISNGDGCKCNPDNYEESNLIDPTGHYGTNPYGYSSSSNSNDDKKEERVEKKLNQVMDSLYLMLLLLQLVLLQ